MMPYVLPLDRITLKDGHLVGGKALRLGELRQAGLNVPPGFVVTTEAYRAFVAANGLDRGRERAGSPAQQRASRQC